MLFDWSLEIFWVDIQRSVADESKLHNRLFDAH